MNEAQDTAGTSARDQDKSRRAQPAHIKRDASAEPQPPKDEAFRDTIATVDKQGNRIWIYVKRSFGKFTRLRQWFGYSLLALLFAGPFIRIGGEPLLMFNIIERHFVFFGQSFWPQDIFLFVIGFITFIVFIALFTVAFGRLFCGWACPQTVFMEFVFRRIEYAIEGDWKQQQALNKSGWTTDKALKKAGKHTLFFLISFIIGNTFFAYIIGSDMLWRTISEPAAQHTVGLTAMFIFSGVFYGNFAFFREQACTTVCPYGRLQGVLLDRRSTVIAYDHVRGEPRGLFRKGEERSAVGKGDCIDCKACVHVCPTGIDIRNGTQLECVNCTACIDACDHMMTSVGLPTGLVRYASESEIADRKPWRFTLRMRAYSGVLLALVGVLAMLILLRTDTETTILRTPGLLYQTQSDGRISNLYAIQVLNKSHRELPITLKLMNAEGEIKTIGKTMELMPGALDNGAFFIILPKDQLQGMKTKLVLGVFTGDRLLEKVRTSFVGPMNLKRT